MWLNDIKVDEIQIWFVRNNVTISIPVFSDDVMSVMGWAETVIEEALATTDWKPNLEEKNEYFCKFICGVRGACEHYLDLISKKEKEDESAW